MRKLFLFFVTATLLFCHSGCVKSVDNDGLSRSGCHQPHNAAPAELRGGWASGFSSYTQIVDAYNGNILGYTWESAKYFSFTADGTGAEFYYMAKGQYSQVATKAVGTVEFDPGSTAQSGSFTFYACQARYKSWGNPSVDRKATDEELHNNLTRKFYYVVDGEWLRIEPDSAPNQYTSSFQKLN